MIMTQPRRGWNMRGIQARVILLVVLGVVASMLVPGWVAWRSVEALTERMLIERETDAAVAAQHLDNVVQREWRRLQEVASAPELVSAEGARTLTPRLEALRRAYLSGEILDRTFITDRAGRVRLAEPESSDAGKLVIAGATQALAADRPTASGLVHDARGEYIHLFVPIRDWTGKAVGLAVGEIRANSPRLTLLLREHPVAVGGSITVFDVAGQPFASSSPEPQASHLVHQQFIAERIASGQTARGTCTTCHGRKQAGEEELMAFVPVKQVRWGICLREPQAATLADANALRRSMLVWTPILFGLGVLFAYGAAQSVLRPVRILTKSAGLIAAGDLTRPIPPLGTDELGRLGQSLERMRSALGAFMAEIEQANTTLEQRVEQRTKELEGLYRQMAERDEARSRLLRQVITAQEDERKRLARELHDETCQTISALAMRLETAIARLPPGVDPAPMVEARMLAVRTLDELHRVIYDLRPSVLDDLGLWSAIRWYAERQLTPRGVAVRCEFTDVERRLPPLMETALFRVVQEAISNIARHAKAEQALIQCAVQHDVLTIEIEDDGEGFDRASVRRPSDEGHGWGLLGITERVEALGGKVEIDAAPGQGVRLVVTVRIPAEISRG